jgi:hypothetical protein
VSSSPRPICDDASAIDGNLARPFDFAPGHGDPAQSNNREKVETVLRLSVRAFCFIPASLPQVISVWNFHLE